MKPVYQTMFKPETGPGAGNCWQAAVASIFELELEDVPHFAEHEDGWDRYCAWVNERGLFVVTCSSPVVGAVGLATGKSPRGDFNHAVVVLGDEIIHDPHPSGDGVVGDPTEVDYYVPFDVAAIR